MRVRIVSGRSLSRLAAAGAIVALWAGSAGAADVMRAPPPQPYAAPPAIAPISTAVFFGGNAKEDSIFGYLGFVNAANGDLGRNGWLYRVVGGFGNYDYTTTVVPGGKVDADQTVFDLTLGYQWFMPSVRYSLYGGLNFQNHSLSPTDPTNSARGSEAGFKVQGELETLANVPYYGSALASYSTANDEYWSRFRLGARYGALTVGPELTFQGNEEYNEARYGAFLKGFRLGGLDSEVSVGYADASGTSGPSSFYVSLGFSYAF